MAATTKPIKSLVTQTESLLVKLHHRARRRKIDPATGERTAETELDLAEQLRLVQASTQFLAARAKLVPEEPAASGLAALRDEMSGGKPNGEVAP